MNTLALVSVVMLSPPVAEPPAPKESFSAAVTRIAAEIPADSVDLRRVSAAPATRPSRRSVVGAIAGAAVGAAAGLYTAAHLAFKQCGSSCADEKILMGVSIVGMPILGGYIGARVMDR